MTRYQQCLSKFPSMPLTLCVQWKTPVALGVLGGGVVWRAHLLCVPRQWAEELRGAIASVLCAGSWDHPATAEGLAGPLSAACTLLFSLFCLIVLALLRFHV